MSKIDTSVIYEYNNTNYFVSVLKDNFNKIEGISETSNYNDIIIKYGKPTSIYKFNDILYVNYKNNKFVCVFIKNKLTEIIYYD